MCICCHGEGTCLIHAVPSFTGIYGISPPARGASEFQSKAITGVSAFRSVKLPHVMNGDSHPRWNPLRTAPNILTLARICLMPFLVAAILEGHYLLSFVLFIVAGLSDALDGFLARWLKQSSMLGHYLDPVADKLLLSTLFLVLMHKNLIPVTVTVLVLGRDVGIILVAAILYAAVGRREFHPSLFGKANTLAQILAVAVVLLRQLTDIAWVVIFRQVALDLTMLLTVASGLHYAWLVSRRMATPAVNGAGGKHP
jgi:cardiolipin synthase (CMP-forming)